MKAKTLLITAGIVTAGLALMAYQKVQTLLQVFDRMSIKPSGITDFSLNLQQINFKLDFKITNPTNEGFSVTGASIARLKRITAYYDGRFMGIAEVNLDAIEIPARSYTILKKMPFQVSTQNLLEAIFTIDQIDINKLSLHAVVTVLGNDYIIEG
ncbi:hypothetical protein [Flavobacterium sp.]|uniref:hypothetical protein n=1 Tax=Flavobacterium sp. TaxID=239 RepID=UPI0040348624